MAVVSDRIVIASTNQQVDSLNGRCQRLLRGRGFLSGEGIDIKDGFRAFVGDRLLLRQNAPRLGIANGDFATVIKVDGERDEIRVQLDDGRRILTISLDDYDRERVTLGYASTSFSAQGGSFASVYLFIHGNMTDAQMAYVMGSRHRDRCCLFTTLDDAGDGLMKLVRDMSKDRTKLLSQDTALPHPQTWEQGRGIELTR